MGIHGHHQDTKLPHKTLPDRVLILPNMSLGLGGFAPVVLVYSRGVAGPTSCLALSSRKVLCWMKEAPRYCCCWSGLERQATASFMVRSTGTTLSVDLGRRRRKKTAP